MSRQAAYLYIGVGFLAAASWLAATSALFLYMAGAMGEFAFPYGQWLVVALDFRSLLVRPHGWAEFHSMLLWPFLWAPLIPTAVAGIAAFGVWRRARTPVRKPYGDNRWATDDDRRSGKIRSHRY